MRIIRQEIERITDDQVKAIEGLLENNLSTIFQEPIFNQAVAKVFGTTFFYYLAYDNHDTLVAVCPLHSVRNGLVINSYSSPAILEVPYGGWVFDKNKVHLPELLKDFALASNENLTYCSTPQINEDEYAAIRAAKRYETAVIDLSLHEDRIWEECISSEKRNKIRKAMKSGITVEGIDHLKFREYYQLMQETYQRANLKIKPQQYYLELLNAYGLKDKLSILLAKRADETLAGIVLLRNKYFCHYWLGAHKAEAENLGQGELLQWEAIKWAKLMHSQYYDLCVVEQDRLPNISQFKLGFSRKIAPFYAFSLRSLRYRIISRLNRL